MKKILNRITSLIFLATIASGCTTVVRENILSSVNTGIGLAVVENPQSQLYEVKAGFIRSQFFSVPTAKSIIKTNGTDVSKGSPSNTPNIVSGIRVKSSAKDLFIGMDVAESFAVGEAAVKSDAAIVMYLSLAENPDKILSTTEIKDNLFRNQLSSTSSKIEKMSDSNIEKSLTLAKTLDLTNDVEVEKNANEQNSRRTLLKKIITENKSPESKVLQDFINKLK